jgi:site-specific DNA-methyltransferase (adenine-specific)
MKKSPRNKTIDFSLDSDEGKKYSSRSPRIEDITSGYNVFDKMFCGDIFEGCRRLPEAFADIIIVDPPYNITKNYHGNRFCASSEEEYGAFTRRWMDAVLPCLKPNGTVYVCCDWYSGMMISEELRKRLCLRGRITWQREKGRGAESNWKNCMEDIWYATASDNFKFNLDAVKIRRRVLAPYKEEGVPKDWTETADGKFRDTCPSNFWDDISIPYWSMAENTAHPTQKPEKLLAKLILASSDKGDVVFDPFGGSGSTAVVAKKLERRFVSIEQNPLYCAWAEKRLELAETDKSVQGFSDGVFWERNTANYILEKTRKKAKNT